MSKPLATLKRETIETIETREHGRPVRITVKYGFDGAFAVQHKQRPYLSVTVDIEEWERGRWHDVGGGASHDTVRKHFPQLADLCAFHLCTTEGPTHYAANVVYLAGDRDHNGLRKGERRQLRNGKTGLPCWRLRVDDGTPDGADLPGTWSGSTRDSAEQPTDVPRLAWLPWWIIGEGKARELDAARRVAIWPDATDAELSAEPEALRAALAARLPALLDRFRAVCAAAGVPVPNDDGTVA